MFTNCISNDIDYAFTTDSEGEIDGRRENKRPLQGR